MAFTYCYKSDKIMEILHYLNAYEKKHNKTDCYLQNEDLSWETLPS